MMVLRTARFDEEAARYNLHYTCEDCGHFDRARERCRHEWPAEAHRRQANTAPLSQGATVTFCKEFEVR